MTREERDEATRYFQSKIDKAIDDSEYMTDEEFEFHKLAIDALEWLNRPCVVNASEIKQDDEWMQENEWDEVYKKENITPCVEDAEVEKSFIKSVEAVKDLLPCDNAISRQAVLEALKENEITHDAGGANGGIAVVHEGVVGLDDMREVVMELPPVSPTIPTCEDAISRQDAIEAVKHAWGKGLEPTQFLEELPPVSPARPTGHWIETATEYYQAINEKGGGVDENTDYFTDDIACPECLAKFSMIDNETERFKYCPNCGSYNGGEKECR